VVAAAEKLLQAAYQVAAEALEAIEKGLKLSR
jgi:hypothetical protein